MRAFYQITPNVNSFDLRAALSRSHLRPFNTNNLPPANMAIHNHKAFNAPNWHIGHNRPGIEPTPKLILHNPRGLGAQNREGVKVGEGIAKVFGVHSSLILIL